MKEICEIRATTPPPPPFSWVSLFETLQAHNPFTITTKPLSNKTRETFFEGFKWMCNNLFDINDLKDFNFFIIFSKCSKHFISERAQGNPH